MSAQPGIYILKRDDSILGRYFDTVEDAHRYAKHMELPEPYAQWTHRLLPADMRVTEYGD